MSLSHNAVRRSATYAAGAALAASALVAGAGVANAAPGDVDVTGVITNSVGQPLAGAEVDAYTIGANGYAANYVDGAVAGADGRFNLTGLDAASLASRPSVAGQTQFKLVYSDGRSPSLKNGARPARYKGAWLGGFEVAPPSPAVAVPAGATTPVAVPNQILQLTAGLAVTILGPAGAPVTDGSVGIYDGKAKSFDGGESSPDYIGGDVESDDNAYDNPDTPQEEVAPLDGVAIVSGLTPGEPVKVAAFGSTDVADPNLPDTVYSPRFFGQTVNIKDAKTVVPALGAYAPISIILGATLTPITQPSIDGDAYIGNTLKANPGSWAGGVSGYNYQWYRSGALVASGPTYLVTKADKKKKLKLVVTAYGGTNLLGQAVTDQTAKVGKQAKIKAKRGKAGAINITVKGKKAKPTGKVVLVNEDGKKASKKATLKNGKASLTPKNKFFTDELTAVYLGNKKLSGASTDIGGGGGGGKGKKG